MVKIEGNTIGCLLPPNLFFLLSCYRVPILLKISTPDPTHTTTYGPGVNPDQFKPILMILFPFLVIGSGEDPWLDAG